MSDLEQRPLLATIEEEDTDPAPTSPDAPRGLIELWYSLVGLRWATLVVVTPGDAARGWWLAQALVAVPGREPPLFKALNLVGATSARIAAVSHALAPKKLNVSRDRTRFVVAADDPLAEPGALGVLSTCDAILLLVERGRTRIQDAQRILKLVGRERFIGVVLDRRSGLRRPR